MVPISCILLSLKVWRLCIHISGMPSPRIELDAWKSRESCSVALSSPSQIPRQSSRNPMSQKPWHQIDNTYVCLRYVHNMTGIEVTIYE